MRRVVHVRPDRHADLGGTLFYMNSRPEELVDGPVRVHALERAEVVVHVWTRRAEGRRRNEEGGGS
jgi:hypothetical protein